MADTTKTHGLRPITLREIPLNVRTKAAAHAARHGCVDESERAAVLTAALFPSERVYWVPRAAAEELLAAA